MTTQTTQTITLGNEVTVDLLIEAGELRGLGEVRVGETLLRSGAVPLAPYLKSDKGVIFTRFRLERVEMLPDGGAMLHTTALGLPQPEGAYEDEYNGLLLWVRQTPPVLEAALTWILRPEALQLHETAYTGFSYTWRFASATESLHRIVAIGTWELSGRAEGNTLLACGQVTPPVYTAEADNHFTSACLKRLNMFGDPQGMSFQLTPRYGLHQVFDFQAGPLGTLLGYWPTRADVRSYLQKNPGEDVVFVVDATCFTLTQEVEIPRKCILFASGENLPEHELRNRWKDAHDYVGDLTRGFFNVKRSRPLPEATIGYGTRLMDDGSLQMRVGNDWVPSQEWLIAMADVYFPELASRGIRRIIPEPIVQTDPSERGNTCKFHSGIHGDLNVGSVCCVHRYVPAECWGGKAAWAYYYNKAHEYGMEAGHWIGPHLSYNAPILAEHPEYRCIGANTLNASGGYPNFELACLNWNSGARQWIFEDLKRWKEEIGLDYIWFDSLGNLGFYPVDFSKGMEPNTMAIAEFIGDLQAIGISQIEVEGVSPFGIAACGMFDPNRGNIRDEQSIVGQNSLDWLVGNEDMWPDQQPRVELHHERTEEQARQIFFRFLANRTVPMLGRFSRGFGPRADWYKPYLDTYFAVEHDLVRRLLLPERAGVRWTGGAHDVLFAYDAVTLDLAPGATVAKIVAGTPEPVAAGAVLQAEPWSVYRIAK
jgi:hypothetical protein